jgi:hypothetical protein
MPTVRPYLSAAFVCEKVLQEKDEVVSAIRIVDTLFVSLPKNLPADANPAIPVTVLLGFKKATPGTQPEKHRVTLRLNTPSSTLEPQTADLVFPEGEPAGANLIVNLTVPVKEFGLFGLDVLVDDELVTRVPFRLQERPAQLPPMMH